MNEIGIVKEKKTKVIVTNKSKNPTILYFGKKANDATMLIILKNNINNDRIIDETRGVLKIISNKPLNSV